LPLWQEASEKLVEWGNGANAPLDPPPKGQANVDQLLKMAAGAIRSAAQHRGKGDLSGNDLLAYGTEKLEPLFWSSELRNLPPP